MFSMGSRKTFEKGAYDRLSTNWEGGPVRKLLTSKSSFVNVKLYFSG